jgi:glycosyltransferase involved in cell wall biosynthesis
MTSEPPKGHRRRFMDRDGQPTVSFVLPAFNEEENISRAIEGTANVAARHCSAFEIIVVDDGSTDRTAALVEESAVRHPQVRLVRHPTNLGYGQALRSGFADAALDFVFYTDSDNQFDMNELPLLLAWVDQADVVAGFRRVRHDPFMRRANAWCWNRLVRALFYVPVRDIDCAFKLYRREPLAAVDIQSRGAMIDTEIMVKLARRGSAIVEVGVTHRPRTAGTARGAKLHVILRALGEVWRMYPQLSRIDPGEPPVVMGPSEPGPVGAVDRRRQEVESDRQEASV